MRRMTGRRLTHRNRRIYPRWVETLQRLFLASRCTLNLAAFVDDVATARHVHLHTCRPTWLANNHRKRGGKLVPKASVVCI
ncbi:hypothetical protein CC79DRAFT_190517 [Sarocladium strictum]